MALTLENIFNTGGKVLGALETYDLYNTSKNIEGRADPFAPYRPGYGQQLRTLMDDPSNFEKHPEYKFIRDSGLEAVERKMAAGGYNKSGNMAAELAQFASGLAATYRGQELDRLANLAGAGISPSPASTALQGKAQTFDQTGQLLASLGYDITGRRNLGTMVSSNAGKISDFLQSIFGGGGGTATGEVIGNIGSWGGSAGAGTIGSFGGGGMAAAEAASPLGQMTLADTVGGGTPAAATQGGFLKNVFSPTNLANAGGLLAGSVLTNQLATSKEGQIGGNIGAIAGTALSSGGGIALGAKLGLAAGPVGAIVGAALGSVLGNAFGNEAKNVGIVQDVTNGIVELQKAKKVKDPTTGKVLTPEELATYYQPFFAEYVRTGSIIDAKAALPSTGNSSLDAVLASNAEYLWRGKGDIIDALDKAAGRPTYAQRKGKKADRAKGMKA